MIDVIAKLLRREAGEKSQAPEIHAGDWNGPALKSARRREQCAVAAEDDDRIGGDVGEIRFAVGIDADYVSTRPRLHPGDQLFDGRLSAGLLDVGDDEQAHRIS